MKPSQPAAVLLALVTATCAAQTGRAPEPSAAQRERALALARRLLVVDTHIDVPYRLEEAWADVTRRTSEGDFDFERAREGGLDAAWMSIYVPSRLEKEGGAKSLADRLIDRVEALVGRAPDRAALAASPDAVEAAARAGKLALPMGIENGSAIEGDLANLEHFFQRGVRYVTLTHAEDNTICDSSYTEPGARRWHGLSPFGRQVVAEMNRLGIMVDLSHVSDEAFDQALAITQAPPIASHSSCRHFTPGFERNLDDARIRALAGRGGVIQINFGSAFLSEAANQASLAEWKAVAAFQKERGLADGDPELEAFHERWRREHPEPRASVDDVADHIEHVVALVGADHVGIGSDFEGVGDSLPTGLGSVADYPNLIAELLARGWSEGDVAKLLGGNLQRVWREVEATAKRLARAPAG